MNYSKTELIENIVQMNNLCDDLNYRMMSQYRIQINNSSNGIVKQLSMPVNLNSLYYYSSHLQSVR